MSIRCQHFTDSLLYKLSLRVSLLLKQTKVSSSMGVYSFSASSRRIELRIKFFTATHPAYSGGKLIRIDEASCGVSGGDFPRRK